MAVVFYLKIPNNSVTSVILFPEIFLILQTREFFLIIPQYKSIYLCEGILF